MNMKMDYHIQIDGHGYSVPYRYAEQQFDVRLTASTVECFSKQIRIAAHLRSHRRDGHTTIPEQTHT